jgi:hypothetical protein
MVSIEQLKLIVCILPCHGIVFFAEDSLEHCLVWFFALVIFNLIDFGERLDHHKIEIKRRRKEDTTLVEILEPIIVIVQKSLFVIPSWDGCYFIFVNARILHVAIFQKLLRGVLDPAPATLKPGKVEIKQSRVRDVEPVQQPPEMVDMAPAQRNDRDRCIIHENAARSEHPRQNDFFAVAFTQNDEPGEV